MKNRLELLSALSDAIDGERYAAAVALLTEAIQVAPEDPALHHCRGAVQVLATVQWPIWRDGSEAAREASLRAAVTDFDRAILLHPGYAEAHLNRGLAWGQLADRKRRDDDLTRALELGLEPVFALQAHSARGADGDNAIVNVMRKTRGVGDAWRDSGPQRTTLRGIVPAPPDAKKTSSAASGAAKAKNKRTGAAAKTVSNDASPGAVDWAAINRRAEQAFKDAVKAHAAGKGGPTPIDAKLDAWMEGFPEPLRPAVRVLLVVPRPDDPWATACGLAGKGNEVALAKVIVGRAHPPFVSTQLYLLQAAALFHDEPAFLAKVADDFLTQLEGLENYRLGQENTLAQLRGHIPSPLLSADARAIAEKLSANKKYAPIAAALRDWAGLTE